MAELVNQRIQDMVGELEQMQRIGLFTAEEIREISRNRKEHEYKIQRRMKEKEDYIQYIEYEMILLEDIKLRRKQININEKKSEIEYAICKRVNKVFKQFIYRFQNDIEIYFQYIKFCYSVGYNHAISSIMTQMLQIHGDKPKMWQTAAKWEYEGLNNIENAKKFLLQGIHRHNESDVLYLELFYFELLDAFHAEDDETKGKCLKRADIVWKNAIKKIPSLKFHWELYNVLTKFEMASAMLNECRDEFWCRHSDDKEAWINIAYEELNGNHWSQIDECLEVKYYLNLKKEVNTVVCVFEAAIERFRDESLATMYVQSILKLDNETCSYEEQIELLNNALLYCHKRDCLIDELYDFWINLMETNGTTDSYILAILEEASKSNTKSRVVWEKRLLYCKGDVNKMLTLIKQVKLSSDDVTYLWNVLLDNIKDRNSLKNLYEKCKVCDDPVLLKHKPKFLDICFELNDKSACVNFYNDLMKTPPIQLEVHEKMIEILNKIIPLDIKQIKKCYEFATQSFGKENYQIWLKYIAFEFTFGSAKLVPSLYQRAVGMLDKKIVDKFINEYMAKKNDLGSIL